MGSVNFVDKHTFHQRFLAWLGSEINGVPVTQTFVVMLDFMAHSKGYFPAVPNFPRPIPTINTSNLDRECFSKVSPVFPEDLMLKVINEQIAMLHQKVGDDVERFAVCLERLSSAIEDIGQRVMLQCFAGEALIALEPNADRVLSQIAELKCRFFVATGTDNSRIGPNSSQVVRDETRVCLESGLHFEHLFLIDMVGMAHCERGKDLLRQNLRRVLRALSSCPNGEAHMNDIENDFRYMMGVDEKLTGDLLPELLEEERIFWFSSARANLADDNISEALGMLFIAYRYGFDEGQIWNTLETITAADAFNQAAAEDSVQRLLEIVSINPQVPNLGKTMLDFSRRFLSLAADRVGEDFVRSDLVPVIESCLELEHRDSEDPALDRDIPVTGSEEWYKEKIASLVTSSSIDAAAIGRAVGRRARVIIGGAGWNEARSFLYAERNRLPADAGEVITGTLARLAREAGDLSTFEEEGIHLQLLRSEFNRSVG